MGKAACDRTVLDDPFGRRFFAPYRGTQPNGERGWFKFGLPSRAGF